VKEQTGGQEEKIAKSGEATSKQEDVPKGM